MSTPLASAWDQASADWRALSCWLLLLVLLPLAAPGLLDQPCRSGPPPAHAACGGVGFVLVKLASGAFRWSRCSGAPLDARWGSW